MNGLVSKIKRMLPRWAGELGFLLLALCVGAVLGAVGALFHHALSFAGRLFGSVKWLILLLPAAGIAIVFLYRLLRVPVDEGTDSVFEATRNDNGVKWQLAPLIFAGTFLTHLTGGSAGREGAALQLGASLSCSVGRLFKLSRTRMHIIEMCGMSALFSALFGTPVAAAFFAIEVVDVGMVRYRALLPCLISSLIAFYIAGLMNVEATRFELAFSLDALGAGVYLKIALLAALCALVAILFCNAMHYGKAMLKRLIKNDYLRIIVCAAAIILLTYAIGTRDYNGAGMASIERALKGYSRPFSWLIKLLFTVITLSGGFRGGEIVPSFFVGACFGCAVGGIIGLDAGFAAAIGMTAVFCGVTNAPAASLIIATEMFSGSCFTGFALCAAVSFFASGKCSLYHSQKYLESKYSWDGEN